MVKYRSWRRHPVSALCAVSMVVAGCATATAPHASADRAADPRFILTFWCGPPLAQFDDARAAEIAAAGFTVVGPPCTGGSDPDLNARALEVAARHGLRMWVRDHRISPASIAAPDGPAQINAAVARYTGSPALDGYFVDDEPTVSDFAGVAAVVTALRAADPRHIAYVNLLPDYAPADPRGAPTYDAYVEQFISTVHPQLLSYDYYPFGKEKDRSTFFENLAVIRAAALRHDLPFMLIMLATPHGPYRDPTEAELAWQVHHALAYGARGISYFTYWTPEKSGDWNFRNGLIMDGRPTLHYFQAARLNRDARALGEALAPFRSIAVADAQGEIGVAFPIGPIAAIEGGPITAGLFGDGSGRLAALLVNRDYRYGVTAHVALQPGASPPAAFDAETRAWQAAEATSFVLPPGGARLLCWSAGAHGCG